MKVHTYVVRGRGGFPIDALRTERAWPAQPKDADRIAFSLVRHSRRAYDVELQSYTAPRTARWASFVWEVLE